MRLTRKEAQALGMATTGGHKYGARATMYNSVRYASAAEAARAMELDVLLRAMEIQSWEHQPRFELGVPENVYVADFRITGPRGRVWVEDVKGMRTAKFNRDVRLWKSYGPCPLHILTRKGQGWEREIIEGKP